MNIFLEAADILSRVTTTDKYALVVRSLIESSGEKAKTIIEKDSGPRQRCSGCGRQAADDPTFPDDYCVKCWPDHKALLRDKLQSWPGDMALSSDDIADLFALIESSGEKGRIPSVAGELIDREWAEDEEQPAPSPGPLHERIKELMVYVAHWQTTRDQKKFPWTDEDKKAFGEVLRILQRSLPAPLPAEVEEALKCMKQNAPWGYDDDSELEHQEYETHMAALAVIRAALTATIKPPLTVAPTTKVTREWLTGAIGMVAFRAFTCENHRALVDCIEQDMARLEEMLRELGIVVEVKP